MPTCTIRLPDTWKDNLVTLRDTLPEALGQELIAALASRTPEQLQAMVRAMQSGGTPTALEASPPPEATAPPEATPERLLNRPIPTGLAGLFTRLLDAAQADPGRVRSALIQATKFL
jgi:hypothetical protein